MIKQFSFYLVVTLFAGIICSCGHPPKSSVENFAPGAPLSFENNQRWQTLPGGDFEVDIMDSLRRTEKQKHIINKYQNALLRDSIWFEQYLQQFEMDETPSYDKRMGISAAQYMELNYMDQNPVRIKTGIEKLQILKKDSLIQFKGTGKLAVFDSLEINMISDIVKFRGFTLTFKDSLEISKRKSGLGESYKGFYYHYVGPIEGVAGIPELQFMNRKEFTFILGKLESGRIVVKLTGSETEEMKEVYRINLPVVLRD